MKKLLPILALLFISFDGFCQKEALTWFFGSKIRFNFHAGGNTPQQFFPSSMIARNGSICMSDKNSGTAFYYSDGQTVWSMGHTPMPNGTGLYGSSLKQQPGISFDVPGTTNQYYIFTTGDAMHKGGYYSVIDMSLNSGVGDIVADKKNIRLPGMDSLQGCIMALKHPNHKSYWLVFRTLGQRNYLKVFLVSDKGIKLHSETECLTRHPYNEYAMCKFSPDGKHFIYTSYNWIPEEERTYEYYRFDPINGNFLDTRFLFKALPDKPEEYDLEHRSNGIEFSADSKYLYTSVMALVAGDPPRPKQFINQFDMNRAEQGYEAFETAMKGIAQSSDSVDVWCQMQLARDGRIYIAQDENKSKMYIARIFSPSKLGANCDFRRNEILLSNSTQSTFGLPVIVPSYLNRFDWTGNCSPDSTYFTSYFHPKPDQVFWDFGDGSPVISSFNPVHKFPGPGTYQVTAKAEYPREEYETVTREVRIVNYPNVNLGPDLSVCPGDSVQLGGVIQGDVTWSTGDTTKTIWATMGDYWIRSENHFGCIASDTISITEYLAPTVDNSNTLVFPTTCTGATGYIRGVQVTGDGPFNYEWKDAAGNIVSTSQNAENLYGGTYSLSVTDVHGCRWYIQDYPVGSVGTNFVDDVQPSPAYCGFPNGSIRVIPDIQFSGFLEYSINGGPWTPDSLFTNLIPGDYDVRIRVTGNPSCINYWGMETVADFPSPLIDSVPATPELDDNGDGTLHIFVPGVDLVYTITGPSGTIGPQSSPIFTGLQSGTYWCTVADENGCTSPQFEAEVPQIYSTLVSGGLGASPPVCLGRNTFAHLKIHNFEGLVHIKAVLNYDRSKLTCLPGYLNLNPALAASPPVIDINTSTGRIEVTWDSSEPVTLNDTVTLLTFEFNTISPGTASINWNVSEVELECGPGFHILPANFSPTSLIILDNPKINILDDQICEGDDISISASITPPGSYNYNWLLPNGSGNTSPQLTLTATSVDDEGIYQLIVTDANTCRDTNRMFLDILPLPDAGFPADTDYYDVQELLQAKEGYMQYLWNTGETSSAIWISAQGIYTVEITDFTGCHSIDSIMYLPINQKPFYFYVPNGFTPNGDGINDNFRPVTDLEQIRSFSMKIFDRWGQLIFNTTNTEQGWDGRVSGLKLSNGIYQYQMIYKKLDDPMVEVKGFVQMIH